MTGYAVRAQGLGISYGRTAALSAVDLDLAPDRIHGLLGRNGAGKTTLLSVLGSLRRPTKGSVRVDDQEPFEHERVMAGVCLIRESGDVVPDEPVRVTLDLVGRARPTFDRGYADRLVEAFRLDPKVKPQAMSRGQRSAVGVVIGLASRAPLTMFDELHLGMDAPARQRFYDELLADFAEHPRTILVSSHLISEIEPLLETVTVLHEGRLLLSSETEDLRARGATLTGPADAMDRAVAGHTVLGRRELGPTQQVTLFGDLDQGALLAAERAGLSVGPVPLQDLFIHLTNDDQES